MLIYSNPKIHVVKRVKICYQEFSENINCLDWNTIHDLVVFIVSQTKLGEHFRRYIPRLFLLLRQSFSHLLVNDSMVLTPGVLNLFLSISNKSLLGGLACIVNWVFYMEWEREPNPQYSKIPKEEIIKFVTKVFQTNVGTDILDCWTKLISTKEPEKDKDEVIAKCLCLR